MNIITKKSDLSTRQLFNRYAKEYSRRWVSYYLLFMASGFFTMQICLPICTWMAGFVMKKSGIPYISYNTLYMFRHHPIALLLLLGIIGVLLFSAFFQFILILTGIREIYHDTDSVRGILKKSCKVLINTHWNSVPQLAFYFLFIMPAAGMIYHAPVFSKVTIPEFIRSFLMDTWYYAVPLLLFEIYMCYLALKYIYTLPLVVLEYMPLKEAFAKSAVLTRGRKRHMFFRLALLSVFACASIIIFNAVCCFSQGLFDGLSGEIPYYSAIVIISLIKMFSVFFLIRISVIMFFSVIPEKSLEYDKTSDIKLSPYMRFARTVKYRIIAGIIAIIYCVFIVGHSIEFINIVKDVDTCVISHRGNDGKNGVQNTIPAIAATMNSSHPDYIEIDIQETKDKKFIVLHDANLKKLCGVKKTAHDLTLDELTALKASENGYTANLVSLDELLDFADAHDQKLLIEIKTNRKDSPDMVDNFVSEYGRDILQNGHIIHTLDLNVVEKIEGRQELGFEDEGIKVEGRRLFVSFIIPFNLLYPETNASAYTVEETTVNEKFMTEAEKRDQKVFVWTVNDKDSMEKMILLGADAIITDYPSLLRKELSQIHSGKYQKLVEMYLYELDVFSGYGKFFSEIF